MDINGSNIKTVYNAEVGVAYTINSYKDNIFYII